MYYEHINGKEKKIIKEFTDPKKFNEFAQKYPMPSLGSMFWLVAPARKALPVKKTPAKKVLPVKKTSVKKVLLLKKPVAKKPGKKR